MYKDFEPRSVQFCEGGALWGGPKVSTRDESTEMSQRSEMVEPSVEGHGVFQAETVQAEQKHT